MSLFIPITAVFPSQHVTKKKKKSVNGNSDL